MTPPVLPSNPIVVVVVGVLLFLVSRPIIDRVAQAEGKQWLARIMAIGLVLHLLAAPAQVYVVDHFYQGIADWTRYDNQGATLAQGFRHFNFSLAPGHLKGIVNDGSVSIGAAIVFTFVGGNQVAAFLVFSWLAWLGTILFFRAFSLTFRGADHRRYAYMLFLLPSMIFWTADVSKEAIMLPALGLVAYGSAKLLAKRRGGISIAAVGVTIAAFIRPNELMLAVAGFTVAMLTAQSGSNQGPGRRLLSIIFFGSLLGLSAFLTFHYLHSSPNSLTLNQVQQNNANVGGQGNGSGNVAYSANLVYYPRDFWTMLFDPLPFNAHGLGQLIEALENTVILVLILSSLRNLRMALRAAFARAYVMMCLVFSLAFIYTFASLGNLGLITRERVALFPFFLVLLCIPRGPKRQRPRYEWEVRRRDRRAMRMAALRRPPSGRPTPGPGRLPGRLPGRPPARPPLRPPAGTQGPGIPTGAGGPAPAG